MGAARLGRAALEADRPLPGFFLATLTVPAAIVLGFLFPGGSVLVTVLAVALVALPALGLFVGARDGRRRDRVLLLVFALTGIGLLSCALGYAVATGNDPGRALAARWSASMPEVLAFYRSSGWSEGSLAATARFYEIVATVLVDQLPGLLLAASALHAALVVYPFGRLAGLLSCDMSEPAFARFTTPIAAAVAFIPAGLAAALGGPDLRRPALDVLFPLLVLFFLRGLAIIRTLLDRGRAGLIGRALVYTLVFQMPFPLILALGGLFDEFLDVRGRLDRAAAARGTGGNGS
jgi:Predicted membrane protein (DUF2232)